MSTATMPETQSSMSGDALDVMECFVAGLDDVVYEIAERMSRKRNPTANAVQIEVEDITQAARLMFQGVHDAITRGQLPSDFEPVLQEMQECFQAKCERE